MNYPNNLKYAKTHEWAEVTENGNVRVGISDYAQNELGDLVFVNLPEVGDDVTAGEVFADVESVKAVADILSPVSGTVKAVNEELLDSPELLNKSPYEAWIAEIENAELGDDLMDAAEYESFCAEQE